MPYPYTYPFTYDSGYFVEVDWNNDGDFIDAYDDITGDVKSIHFSRGKSEELGKAEVGQLSIILNNATAKYTPGAGGVISSSLLPKRPIKVYYSASGVNYPLFYGFIEEIIPHPHLTEQDCIITASDGIDFLSRHDMATALYKNALTGTIHGYILTDAGWSATMRTLDAGQNTVPYWYAQDVKARNAQEEIDDSEQGFSYINGAGYFCFEDRVHRTTAPHTTPVGTFNNTMANITYSLNPRSVYNIVKATVTPWALQPEAELWRLKETPSIPTTATYTWWCEALVNSKSVFVDAWTTPIIATKYENYITGDDNSTYVYGIYWSAQSFTPTTSHIVHKIKLLLYRIGSPAIVEVAIRAVDTYGFPVGGDLCVGSFNGDGLTTNTAGEWKEVTFNSDYQLVANTKYAIVMRTSTGTMGNAVYWRYDSTVATYSGGEALASANSGIDWSSYANYDWMFEEWSGTDYAANSQANGLGDDETANIAITTTKFAKTIKLEITNNALHSVYITLLRVRGTWYDDQTKVTRKAEDTTSQTAYQKRTLEIGGKYMTSADTAQTLCDYALAKYKDPKAELTMTIMNQDATTLTQILSREISDRITVVNTKLGINGDYFIDHLEHDISLSGKLHTSVYKLVAV